MSRPEAPAALDRDSLQSTLDEHETCMKEVAAIEAILDHAPDRGGRWLASLLDKLPVLARTLREHFASEEQASLYREVPLKRPRFAGRIERLAAEHAGILAAVEDALEHGRTLAGHEPHHLRELNARVQLVVATIRRHEAEENEIIMSAYWDETGTKD